MLPEHRRAATQRHAVLEQAEDLLMRRWQCGHEAAFGMLARPAQATGRPVYDVAAALLR
jgi:AmiR/NasT family two-component response regulator